MYLFQPALPIHFGMELTVALLAYVALLNLNFEDLLLSFITDILMTFLFVFPCGNKKNIIMHLFITFASSLRK